MNTKGLLFIAMVTGSLLFARVTTNLDLFPNITYDDIELLNATCPEADNCTEVREVKHDNLDYYNCNCEEFCDQYDTCCVDSKYRSKERKIRKPYNCVKPYRTKRPVLMIDSCDPSWSGDHHVEDMEDMCVANAEELEDLFLAVPVTNHETGITYRNYYCAVCNNETDRDQLTFWNMSLISKSEGIMSSPLPDLHFVSFPGVWIIGNETDDIWKVKVNPSVRIPEEIEGKVHDCVPNVISRCAEDWTDTVIRDKCAAYMAIVRVISREGYRETYRNPHCVICNHESLQKLSCSSMKNLLRQTVVPSNTFFVRLFSIYDKENKCDDDKVYDTLAKKCRKVYKG